MNLFEVQHQKLVEVYAKEARSRGIKVSSYDAANFIEFIFKEGRVKGFPISIPYVQDGRATLNLAAYNRLMQDSSFDFDVLFSYYRLARLDSANTVFFNDVELKRLEKILDETAIEVDNFYKNAEQVNDGLFNSSKFTVDFNKAKLVPVEGSEPLASDLVSGTLSLSEKVKGSYKMDTTFLESIYDAVSVNVKSNLVVRKSQPANLGNLAHDDANAWLYEIETQNSVTSVGVTITIPFPVIEKLNSVKLKTIPGVSYEFTLQGKVGESWVSLKTGTLNRSTTCRFGQIDLSGLKLHVSSSTFSNMDNGNHLFIFGLTLIEPGRILYSSTGSSILKQVDPEIGNRPIVGVSAKVDFNAPEGSSVRMAIGYSQQNLSSSPSEVINTDGSSEVEFSLVRYAEATASPITDVGTSRTINGIKYKNVSIDDLGVLDTSQNTFLPSYSEVWTKQNVLLKRKYPDYGTIHFEDAIVNLAGKDSVSEIYPEFQENYLPLYEDAGGVYIQLNYKPYKTNVYLGATTSSANITSQLKGSTYGILKVEVYPSSSRNVPTVINNQVSSVDPTGKVYLNGAYNTKDLFSVTYRGLLDTSALIKKGSLSLKTGYLPGSTVIDANSGDYQVDYDKNLILASAQSLNGEYRCDFTAMVNTSRLLEFTGKLHFSDYFASITLLDEIATDSDAGEYIVLVSEDSGNSISLDNAIELRGVNKGWYTIYIVSKPMSPYPSAIKSFIEAKVSTGVSGFTPLLFDLTSNGNYVDKIGVYSEKASYKNLSKLLNSTTISDLNIYSSVRKNGELLLTLATQEEDSLFFISGSELIFCKIPYFTQELFKEENNFRVHSYLDIKMTLGTQNSNESLITPEVNRLTLTVKYI